MAKDTTTHAPDELLTKTECMHLFCEKMKIGKVSYYKYYRDFIKFKPTAQIVNDQGQVEHRLHRIPYRIALGMIRLLQNQYSREKHPPVDQLIEYMDKVPANTEIH